MIIAVMNAIAYRGLKKSGLQRGLNPRPGFEPVTTDERQWLHSLVG